MDARNMENRAICTPTFPSYLLLLYLKSIPCALCRKASRAYTNTSNQQPRLSFKRCCVLRFEGTPVDTSIFYFLLNAMKRYWRLKFLQGNETKKKPHRLEALRHRGELEARVQLLEEVVARRLLELPVRL